MTGYGYGIRQSPFVPTPFPTNLYEITNQQVSLQALNLKPSGDTSGATDVANINSGISLASSQGVRRVELGSGTWYINNSININVSNISIEGIGPSATSGANTVINALNNGPAFLVSTTGAVIGDWGISNMTINTVATTVATSATAITIDSSLGGNVEDVVVNVNGNGQVGVLLKPVQAALNCQYNKIDGLIVGLAATAVTAQCVFVTAGATTQNPSFNEFYRTLLSINHTSQTGLHLQTCDSNFFYDLAVASNIANMTGICVNFDYNGGNPHWPNATLFMGLDIGFNIDNSTPRMVNTGSPTVIPSPNVIYDFSPGNGGTQVFLTNLEYYGQLHTRVEGSLGYAPGAGTTVTQTPAATSGVTANAICGQITLANVARTSGTVQAFTVSNNKVAINDTVIANIQGGGTANGYIAAVTGVGASSFNITIDPLTTETAQPIVNFSVIKAVAS